MPVAVPKAIINPKSTTRKTKGNIHHNFLFHKKLKSSPATPNLNPIFFKVFLFSSLFIFQL